MNQRWQFSLRGLIGLTTYVAVALGLAVGFPIIFLLAALLTVVVFFPIGVMLLCETLFGQCGDRSTV